MKKMCISLLLIATGMYAADSSSSSCVVEVDSWDFHASASHERDGVGILFGIQSSMEHALQKQFVQMFSHCLAMKLSSKTSFCKASEHVQDTLEICETKVKEARVEAFFQCLKQSIAGDKIKPTDRHVINKMFLNVALEQSGVKIKVVGSAEPKKCQTFFPPYTFVSEGNDELTAEEKELARKQEELAQANKRLFACNNPFSADGR